eukprot:gene10755-11905_t
MGNGGSKIPPSELNDLMHKTHFEEKELQVWYSGFIKDCPDGLLNRDQFIDLYSSFYGSENAKKFVSHVYRTFDANKDGKIDFREFMCSLSVATRGTIDEKLRWAFNVYDIDGDGFISSYEMKTIMRSIAKMNSEDRSQNASEVHELFEAMDTNNDGKLSMGEFIAGAKKDPILITIMEIRDPARNSQDY